MLRESKCHEESYNLSTRKAEAIDLKVCQAGKTFTINRRRGEKESVLKVSF